MGYAQQPYSIHINQVNGLPSNAVYDVHQDKKGFIWFASQDGITRYDGAAFKTYQCEAQVSTAGSCIKEDKYGRIWYENFDGRLYYVYQDSLYALAQKSIFNYAPFAVTDDYLMLVQNTAIDIYELKSLKFLRKINILSDLNFFETSIAVENDFYFILKDSIFCINNQLELSSSGFLVGKGEIMKRISAADSVVYVVSKLNSRNTLYILDRKLQHPRTAPIPGPKLIQGSSFIDGKFWVHTPEGSFSYSLKSNANEADELLFSGKSVSNLIKDRQGNYWFTTTSDGVFLMNNLEQKIYTSADFNPTKIVKSGSQFLLANREGSFMRFDPKGKTQLSALVKGNSISELYYLYSDPTKGDIIYSAKGMSFFPNGRLDKAVEYEAALKEIVRIDDQYYAFVANGFCALIKAPSYRKEQLSVWDSVYQHSYKYHNNDYAVLLSNIRGRAIAYNKVSNAIYCSGNRGFYKITPNGVDTIKNNGQAFYASKIITFDNELFVLNTKGNLYKIDEDGNFTLLNEQLGLAAYEIKFLRQFGSKLLLMNQRYLYYVDLKSLKCQILNINISPSLVSDLYLEEDNVFIVLKEGIVQANLHFNPRPSARSLFQINGFKVNDIVQHQYQNATFHHTQNDVSIHFSILDFGSVQMQSLFYRLNNEEWKVVSPESRNLQFKALSPGYYEVRFKLGAQILDEKISFIIDAPFWMKWWFILLCITLVAVAVYTYYKWQISLLSRQIKLLREKVELEQSLGKSILTSIKSQMNPHFFYNALNTIQAYIFTNDKRNASVYLGKFSKLTRMILEMSEQEFIPLQEEIQALTLYLELEKMRFDDDFDFELEVDYTVDVEMIKIPSMLIQPYAENAVKHGLLHRKGSKKLKILMTKENKYLKVVVDDNGIGRLKSEEMKKHKKEKHSSFSTRANEQRLEILNRNRSQKVVVEIEDKLDDMNNPTGTQVRLYIPVEI